MSTCQTRSGQAVPALRLGIRPGTHRSARERRRSVWTDDEAKVLVVHPVFALFGEPASLQLPQLVVAGDVLVAVAAVIVGRGAGILGVAAVEDIERHVERTVGW